MRVKGHRRHFLIEQLIGIVLAALQLGDDDRALRFAFLGLVEAVLHAFGLDEQQLVQRIPPGRLEVCRLVNPGVAVPHATETFDEALHLVAGDVARAFEVHVLDPVRGTGVAGALIARAHAIPAPDRDERCGMDLVHEHIQAVLELLASSRRSVEVRPSPSVDYTGHIPRSQPGVRQFRSGKLGCLRTARLCISGHNEIWARGSCAVEKEQYHASENEMPVLLWVCSRCRLGVKRRGPGHGDSRPQVRSAPYRTNLDDLGDAGSSSDEPGEEPQSRSTRWPTSILVERPNR